MSALVVTGIGTPLAFLAVAGIVWFAFGAAWAIGLLAVGVCALAGFHLWHLSRLAKWADSEFDAPVPEAEGAWGVALSALYRRVRLRNERQLDLASRIERFRSAVEALPDGMVILDDTNRIQWANARAQAHLGIDLETDTGQPLQNFVRQPEVVRYLEAADFNEGVVFDSLREIGTTLAIQVVPFGIDERLLISRNITQIEAVARMRRDFIANVSHELKTPLTVITGFLETLQDLELEARQRSRYIALMADQAASMQRLVDDLLTLSTLESDQNALAEAEFDVVPLLLEVSADAKALSAGRHVVALDITDPAMVLGSRDELSSAFGNLVSNAIRYTPDGGRITLAWRIDDDGRGVFSVADTGIGIAPEHVPRLTERFYRVDRSRSRETGGTGLGLAIVKHVLLRHQAELDVMSELGRGSTFSVVLPGRRVRRAESAAPGDAPGAGTAATVAPPPANPEVSARAPSATSS
ncbi:MAG TPA: phosphate regulon sensor histidine kinase PhoR [Casimicrobiaceae bacterium]|nr:phosphate regulon sensor histidine kinase PhoR [Casimicrobiaceae bacterium]